MGKPITIIKSEELLQIGDRKKTKVLTQNTVAKTPPPRLRNDDANKILLRKD
jgi:hypothetical protein